MHQFILHFSTSKMVIKISCSIFNILDNPFDDTFFKRRMKLEFIFKNLHHVVLRTCIYWNWTPSVLFSIKRKRSATNIFLLGIYIPRIFIVSDSISTQIQIYSELVLSEVSSIIKTGSRSCGKIIFLVCTFASNLLMY